MKINIKQPFKNILKSPLWGSGGFSLRGLGGLVFFFFLPLWGSGGFVSAQSLDDYLQIAAENNAGVKAAYAEFEASMQEAPQVSSLPDPTLTMSAFGQMVETRLGPQEATFSLMQMFPWFGTLAAREDAAILRAEAKFQAYLDERNNLFYQVSEQYYKLYKLKESVQFQRNNLNILEDYKELALAKVRAGSGALADVLQAEIVMNETQTTLEVLEIQYKPLSIQFNALLNRDKNADIHIPEELDLIDRAGNLQALPAGWQGLHPEASGVGFKRETIERQSGGTIGLSGRDTLFENHPRVEAMEKMLAAAKAQEIAAKKSGMPSFGIGLNYGIIGEQTTMNPIGNGQDVIMPMLSISLPIFRKKYKAAQKEAQFMQESYFQRKIEVKNTLSSEFATAVFTLEKSREMLELYEQQVESSQQVLNLLLSSYQNAATDFEEVLRVRQELLKYQLAVADAEVQYFTALAKIKYLKG